MRWLQNANLMGKTWQSACEKTKHDSFKLVIIDLMTQIKLVIHGIMDSLYLMLKLGSHIKLRGWIVEVCPSFGGKGYDDVADWNLD